VSSARDWLTSGGPVSSREESNKGRKEKVLKRGGFSYQKRKRKESPPIGIGEGAASKERIRG